MTKTAPLRVEVRHRVGSLEIGAAFAVTEPWTVLFGPSGAGKSTLLRIIAGLVRADSARVEASGRIGFVTQSAALFPHLSVEDNIRFGLGELNRDARRARVNAMLTLFQLEGLARRLPGRLSGGEQQRVALARAVAPRPAVLLLDEPFSAVDGALKETLLRTLSTVLEAEDTAAVYVTHDLAEVFQLGATVLLLEQGRLIAQGAPEVVLREHRARLLRQLGAS